MNSKHTIAVIPLIFASLALPLAASAAANDWAGPYIGAHVGTGQDNSTTVNFASGGSSDSFDMTGPMGGVQAGYNWSAGGMVVGIEGTASASDISGDGNCPNTAYQCGAKMDELYTIKGRIGIPLNDVLLYATAGGASSRIKATLEGPQNFSQSDYQTGWLAGLGAAMPFANHWNGSLELQFIDFGSNDYTLGKADVSVENKFSTLNVGVNYLF